LAIAVENMANAIKKISLQRGYDITEYVLCCFGGAGAQVACLIADTLGMKKIFLHPYAGVLSAYGMGLADVRAIREAGVEQTCNQDLILQLQKLMNALETEAKKELPNSTDNNLEIIKKINLKYDGSNSTFNIDFALDVNVIRNTFELEHKSRYGFIQLEKTLIIESASVEVIQKMDTPEETLILCNRVINTPQETVRMFTANQWHDTPVYRREDLQPGHIIPGTAIIVEKISTIIIEPNWKANLTERNHLILQRQN